MPVSRRTALAEIEQFFDNEPLPDTPEAARFDILADLVGRYEAEHYPMVAADTRLEWWTKPLEVGLPIYKGYAAHMYFDGADQIYVGHITGIRDIVGFHVDVPAQLERACQKAVDDYISMRAQLRRDRIVRDE